jgi:hypothetical protein
MNHFTFLSRTGFDQQRQSGEAAWNLGALCSQSPEDPRFAGTPTVTCSDNAAHHASRVEAEAVAQIPVLMFRDLLERRFFDGIRLLGRWFVLVADPASERAGPAPPRFHGGPVR